jgi:hypothetical protein
VGRPFRCADAFLIEIIESEPFFRIDQEEGTVRTVSLIS